jgi:hypothetical protein
MESYQAECHELIGKTFGDQQRMSQLKVQNHLQEAQVKQQGTK